MVLVMLLLALGAHGHRGSGDSVAVRVSFNATGGTITDRGLFTAGTTAGSYRVIASASGLADTGEAHALRSRRPAARASPGLRRYRAAVRALAAARPSSAALQSPMTMTADGYTPSNILPRIKAARAGGYKLVLNLTGGPHAEYMSLINGISQFDGSVWRSKMEAYNTADIRQAIGQGVADGTIVGASVMDEPYVWGGADGGGNTWGPKGTLTKARVDSLCGVREGILPDAGRRRRPPARHVRARQELPGVRLHHRPVRPAPR